MNGDMKERLCLGTVQLGLQYGIRSQRSERPESYESIESLKKAYNLGIRIFDTASAYGNAEELIGKSGIQRLSDVRVITKISKEPSKKLIETFEKSLSRMNVSKIDGVLLHEPTEYFENDVVRELINIKDVGIVSNIGVSVYDPDDAVKIAQDGIVDYIQVPYNVFDQRLDKTEFFSLAKKNKIKVFARSSFLQGLLLFDIHELPRKFVGIRDYLKKYHSIISEYDFDKREAAMLFSLCKPEIDEVVFGIDNEQQLRENLTILNRENDFYDCKSRLEGAFEGISSVYLNPSRWEEL